MIIGRQNWLSDLQLHRKVDKEYIWVHCASLGEFEQGRPVIEKLKLLYPDINIVVSFFSPSGYDVQNKYSKADYVCYLPFDTPHNAKKFIEILKPKYAIFVKYEIWHYMLKTLYTNNIPSYLISATFRPNQLYFKKIGRMYLQTLNYFTKIFVQNKESEELLHSKGVLNTLVCGDTRVDRVVNIANTEYKNDVLENFSKNHKVIVAGSTWEKDEDILCKYINTHQQIKLIIAPHEINEEHLKNIENKLTIDYIRLSKVNEHTDMNNKKLIIIDSIGILSKIYRYGQIAYVGGGFSKGLHNILEPAAYLMPIIFGAYNYHKFIEANEFISNKSAYAITNYEDFVSILNEFESGNVKYSNIKETITNYLNNSIGATNIIIENIYS